MISRSAGQQLKRIAGQFPAVLLLGARACGKATLARHLLDGRYLDLEKPADAHIFTGDIERSLRQLKGPLILGEAQTVPPLFPAVRALIDEAPRSHGRFVLLASVNPELVRNISEPLAGRVGVCDLTPFLFSEVADGRRPDVDKLWFRGGFPEAFLARNAGVWHAWEENYVRTFVERDIARHRLTVSSAEVWRLLTMLAQSHGRVLNYSRLGRELGYTYHTVQNLLDLLEGYFLIRRVAPYPANLDERLVKSPKVYLRDSGMLHHLLGIGDLEALFTSPHRGKSFEGFMIEQMVALEKLRGADSRFYFFRTHTGAEIDFLIDRGQSRVGFDFKAAASTGEGDWMRLQSALADKVIDRGILVYNGKREFAVSDDIRVIPAVKILSSSGKW